LAFSMGLAAIVLSSKAQTYVSAPMTSTPAAGSYYSNSSITLSPGFSFTATSGQSLYLYIGADCAPLTTAASASQNYILTTTPRIGGITTSAGFANRSACDLMQTVQYVDGLGRPLQTVQVMGSPTDKDIVQPFAYDQFGREATKYLPYAISTGTSDGSYKSNALTAGAGVLQFYNPAGNGISGNQQSNGVVVNPSPLATTGFEPSPLNRVVEQGAPGTPWQLNGTGDPNSTNHTVRIIYTANDQTSTFSTTPGSANMGSRIVALYTATINSDQTRTLARTSNATYSLGQLFVTITRDENWNPAADGCVGTMEEYKDKEGHVILKRTYNLQGGAVQMLSTYYVYDDLGNLAFVLPPGAAADNALPTTALQTAYCYQYGYDERNRLTRKTIPGKGLERIVYNQLDQPVLTQDAVQLPNKQWTVTKYDAMGRVIATGLWTDTSPTALSTATLQSNIYAGAQWDTEDATGNTATYPTGYVISSYPAMSTVLTTNYYDDYTNIPGLAASPYAGPSGYSTMTRGLMTATKTAVLNTPADMLLSANYYDDLGRTIKSYKQHYLGGTANINNYDAVTNTYDFTNAITASTRQHFTSASTSAPSVTIANTYVYDHMGRKQKTFESINGGSNILLAQSDYNEVGQLKTKHLHSATGATPFLQDISYAYNERGWLRTINDPTVATTTTKLFAVQLNYNLPQYGAAVQYNGNISEQVYTSISGPQHVTYAYDRLNRLTDGTSTATFSETGISYDVMGNIQGLTRNGYGALTYTYNSTNQLQSLSGYKSGTYLYDNNGNMKTDGPRGATITYNLLSLPQTVTATGVSITYTYDATGNKLRKVSSGSSTDYISGIQYKPDGTIDFIMTEEGRAIRSGTAYNYEYTLSDQLGNNRVTFDQTTGKVGEDDYYPFGFNVHRQVNAGNNYLYNKKELQPEINEYDYGARFYDPMIGRWNVVDPHAEKYHSWSPYNYVFNNPIKMVDKNGMDGEVTGTGTKKDPYVIKANYYYVKGDLSDKQVKALNDGVAAYNKLGGKDGVEIKNADGSKSYVKYNLSASGVDNADAAKSAVYGDKFTDKGGTERYFGNFVKIGASGSGDDFGSSTNRTVNFNNTNIRNGVDNNGMSESSLLQGIVIHEIGHNLGGEHSDGTSTMSQVNTINTVNTIGPSTTTTSYPSTSKDFTRTIFDRRDTRMQDPNARVLEPGIYTKQEQQ